LTNAWGAVGDGRSAENRGVLIDFELFRPDLDPTLRRGWQQGRAAIVGSVLMFKVMEMQTLYAGGCTHEFRSSTGGSFGPLLGLNDGDRTPRRRESGGPAKLWPWRRPSMP
jgi:hypothetical protein